MIDSDNEDENELVNDSDDVSIEELKNSGIVVTCSEDNELGCDVEDIEIDVLKEEISKLLKTLLISSFTRSSSNLFLQSKLDSLPA